MTRRSALLLAAATLSLTVSPTVRAASGDDRASATVLVLVPPQASPSVRTSDVVRLATEHLSRSTDLRGLSPEQAGIDLGRIVGCPARERFRCLVELARPEDARYLFVFSVEPVREGKDRVSALAIDLGKGRALLGKARAEQAAGWRDRLEDEIFAAALQTDPAEVDASEPRALDRAVSDAFDAFAPLLQAGGHDRTFGAIHVELSCEGCAVYLDDHLVAATTSGLTELDHIERGPHVVRLVRGDAPIWHCDLVVDRNAPTSADHTTCKPIAAKPSRGPERSILIGGGLAASLAGAIVATYGATRATSGPATLCLTHRGEAATTCPSLGTPTFALDATAAPTNDAHRINAPGVAPVPLGLALITAGATWSLGPLAFEDAPWWLVLLSGTALGAATYGAAALAAQ